MYGKHMLTCFSSCLWLGWKPVQKLNLDGIDAVFFDRQCALKRGNTTIATGGVANGIFQLSKNEQALRVSESNVTLWHKRFGHTPVDGT